MNSPACSGWNSGNPAADGPVLRGSRRDLRGETKLAILLSILLLYSCSRNPGNAGPAPGPQAADALQAVVDALAALHEKSELPQGYRKEMMSGDFRLKRETKFDPNRYFSVLDRLKMEDGHVLDTVYAQDGFEGRPVIYARRSEARPFDDLAEYEAARGDAEKSKRDYLDFVRTDQTGEGFFQHAVLRIMGGQFELFWHANYNDTQVICSQALARKHLEQVLANDRWREHVKSLGETRARKWREASMKLPDVTPVVEISGDAAEVRVVTFGAWEGFVRRTFRMRRSPPHVLMAEKSTVILEYDCFIYH